MHGSCIAPVWQQVEAITSVFPESTLFPTVPATQNPGRIHVLISLPHHFLNASRDVPISNKNGPFVLGV